MRSGRSGVMRLVGLGPVAAVAAVGVVVAAATVLVASRGAGAGPVAPAHGPVVTAVMPAGETAAVPVQPVVEIPRINRFEIPFFFGPILHGGVR